MSFDLSVFEPSAAPKDRRDFLPWYMQIAEWDQDLDYDDPATSSPAIQAWYHEMRVAFPALNGPDAAQKDFDGDTLTDYCFARELVQAGFGWSQAQMAHDRALVLAKKHGLGFHDFSSGQTWWPDPELVSTPWWKRFFQR